MWLTDHRADTLIDFIAHKSLFCENTTPDYTDLNGKDQVPEWQSTNSL